MNEPKTANRKSKTVFAKKSFGQNFLVDRNYVDKIIGALRPLPNETIVEIGSGRGALTERLLATGANVTAIELERQMIAVLRERFAQKENFRLIEADALAVDFAEITNFSFQISDSESQIPDSENRNPKAARLVANLPYNISTAILQKLIEQRAAFSEMILMFQREVVERITAGAGDAERGFLTVLVEAYLTAEKLFDVPPNAFAPAPKVWSAVVRLKPKGGVEIENERLFRRLVSQGFRQKRKTLANNLKNFSAAIEVKTLLERCEIAAARRAETLTVAEWRRLTEAVSRASNGAF